MNACSFKSLGGLLLLIASFCADAQNWRIETIYPFDGTSMNFLVVRNLRFDARPVDFRRNGEELDFTIGRAEFNFFGYLPEYSDAYIALERYIPRDEDLGSRVVIVLRSSNGVEFYRQEIVRDAQAERADIPSESGWWVDFGRHQHNMGRGISIDRVGAQVGVRLLTYPTEYLGGMQTQRFDPGIWLSGTGLSFGPYAAVAMRSYEGALCPECTGHFWGERSVPAGDLFLGFVSPTTAVISAPNEPAKLIELAGFSRPMSGLPLSLLTGRWSVLASEEAAFGGFTLDFGPAVFDPPMRPRPARWEHAISFPFGTGRAECFPDRCTIFLSLAGFGQEFVYAEIRREGLGNRHLYQQGPDGRWRVFAARVD